MAEIETTNNLSGLARRLVQDGLLSQQVAAEACATAKKNHLSLVKHLVDKELLDSRTIAYAAARNYGTPIFDLDAFEPDEETTKLVNSKLIQQHHILPLTKKGEHLTIGVADPTELQAIDEIKFHTGMKVHTIIVETNKLYLLIDRLVDSQSSAMLDMGDSDLDNIDISSGEAEEEEVAGSDVDDAPIVRFANKVLLDAIKAEASDIHFEPYEKSYRIRIRQDGVLRELASPPPGIATRLTARIKVMAQLDISERRVPQDGRIKMKLSKTRAIDFRVSTCPTLFGEKVVMRILDPTSAQLGIEVLGYEPDQQKNFMDAINRPYGMVLVTGPTGSGKTVSLYTALNILNTVDRNISTAEDPAEINLPGINQVNVNPKAGLTFAAALRSFLRQDPDVIMVGEIRDLETAEIAIKAAQTGHMVLSTLHTNDAPQTITRLANMGVAPFNIVSAVSLIIAQRLGRKLCEHCKEPLKLPPETLREEGFAEDELDSITVYKAVGCDKCTEGYKGRTGIYQVMVMSESIGRIILEGGNAMEIADQAQKEGMHTLRAAGLLKVKRGILSLDELHRVTTE